MRTTHLIVTIAIITVAIYDAIAVNWGDVDVSVSRFLSDTAILSPVFCFGCGFVCGHLFGYMKPRHRSEIQPARKRSWRFWR